MSRLLAYHGPAISFSDALLVHPHSLIEQAYAPVEMVTGRVNADGFGLGWYAEGEALPGTYHHLTPIWSDMDLPRFGRVVRSSRIFAALRNATPGFHLDLQSIAPFTASAPLSAAEVTGRTALGRIVSGGEVIAVTNLDEPAVYLFELSEVSYQPKAER